ncbi:MAG: hypothetical protein Kilf2KO_42970 [Rhodospirillales bacterium]
MKRALAPLLLVVLLLPGCSVYMAASGDDKKDLSVLASGTPRDRVIAELGSPVTAVRGTPASSSVETVQAAEALPDGSQPEAMASPTSSTDSTTRVATQITANEGAGETAEADPARYDIFSFVQGRSEESNAGRAVFYGAAAILTLGLSEIVATPLEAAVGDQGEMKLRVVYDQADKVTTSQILDEKEGDWVSLKEYEARERERNEALERNQDS